MLHRSETASSESQYAAAGSAHGREPGLWLREVGLTLETAVLVPPALLWEKDQGRALHP